MPLFRGNFVAVFVLIYWLREFLLSVVTNRFELSSQFKAKPAIVLQSLSMFFRIRGFSSFSF